MAIEIISVKPELEYEMTTVVCRIPDFKNFEFDSEAHAHAALLCLGIDPDEEDELDDDDELDEDEDEEDDDDDDDDEDENSPGHDDPDCYDVCVNGELEWDDATQNRLRQLLESWPSKRDQVLEAVFEYYKEVYPDLIGDCMEELRDLEMPAPDSPAIIENLIRIHTISIYDDCITLDGECSWDDEHGIGIRLDDDGISVGQAGDV